MTRSPDSLIELVHRAIAAGIFGQIQGDDRADERARSNPELEGLTPEGIRRLLHDFVRGGGRLDERRETRQDWLETNADRLTIIATHGFVLSFPYQACSPRGCSLKFASSITTHKTPGSKS